MIENKKTLSISEINSNNSEASELKRLRAIQNEKIQKIFRYSESFTMYDQQQDKFIFNDLAFINEKYCYAIQKHNYQNGIIVKKQLEESGFRACKQQEWKVYDK